MKKIFILLALIPSFWNLNAQQLTSPMSFVVNSPANISGTLNYGAPADFGPVTMSTVTGDLEWAYTAEGDSLACTPIVTDLSGKIALIRRGVCSFTIKIYEAQQRGAIACVILNNDGTNSVNGMSSGTNGGLITIPSLMLGSLDGDLLISEMEQGSPVNVSFFVNSLSDAVVSYAKKTPFSQIRPLEGMKVSLYNSGTSTQNNISATLDISNPLGAVETFSGDIINGLDPGTDSVYTFSGAYTPSVVGTYTCTFKSLLDPNDSLVSFFEITNSTFTLDNGDYNGAYGIGVGDAAFATNGYRSDVGASYITGGNGFSGTDITASFSLENPQDFIGKSFTYLLYQWPETFPITNDYSEFTVIGAASHTISEQEGMNPFSLLTETLIDINTFGNINSLAINQDYLIVIKYEGNSFDGIIEPRFAYTHEEDFLSIGGTVFTSQLFLGGWSSDAAPIVQLNLNSCVASPVATDIQTACESFTWIDGNTYTSSNNTASFSYQNIAGCDSTFILDLTIKNNVEESQSFIECPGTEITVGNSTYTVAGTYVDVFPSSNGCDSIVTTNLSYYSVDAPTVDTQLSCETFTWVDGNTYSSSNNTATFTYQNMNGCDSTIVLDLTIKNNVLNSQVFVECPGTEITVGTFVHSVEGIYVDTLAAANGCDSIVTTDLSYTQVNTNISQQLPDLIAEAFGANYQWLDCNSGMSEIINETSQTFATSGAGIYAVQVTENGCTSISECIEVFPLGVNELSSGKIHVYPNPSTGEFSVLFSETVNFIFNVTSLDGKIISSGEKASSELYIDLKNEDNGVYFLNIKLNDDVKSFKLIKQ